MPVLRGNPGSLVFCNIEHGMPEPDWEQLIRTLLTDEALDCRPAVVSQHGDRVLAEKYLMDIGLPCGFVTLRISQKELLKTLLTVLEANEARGKRRYVRATCIVADMAIFNLKVYGRVFDGSVVDIRSAGMAATFHQPIDYSMGKEVDDMQLKLWGSLCRVRAKHIGAREAGDRQVNVFSFDYSSNPESRGEVREFIYRTRQREMDRQFKFEGAPAAGATASSPPPAADAPAEPSAT